jgi:hypothetical protein
MKKLHPAVRIFVGLFILLALFGLPMRQPGILGFAAMLFAAFGAAILLLLPVTLFVAVSVATVRAFSDLGRQLRLARPAAPRKTFQSAR